MVKKEDRTEELNKILLENSLALQKVVTNLAVKIDTLSNNMTKLLLLFEMSAKSFMSTPGGPMIPDVEKDKEFLNKLNMLIDQNKTIAKGLTLMEEKIRERVYGEEKSIEQPRPMMIQSANMQNMQRPPQMPEQRPEFKKLPKF